VQEGHHQDGRGHARVVGDETIRAEFDHLLGHIVLHAPYVPSREQAESEDCFRNAVSTFAMVNA
jgi:hypothetical protein